jgi:uncharacterized protein (DUF169 family)
MYAELADRLINALSLETTPVTVAFSSKPPKGVERFDGQRRACQFVDVARFEGGVFYTDVENQECGNGNFYLGLSKPYDGHLNGEVNSGEGGWNLFYSPVTFQRLLPACPTMPYGRFPYLSYAPLGKTPFSEKLGGMVAVLYCSPAQALFLQRGMNFKSGEIVPGLTGPATCSSVMVGPYQDGKMTYSLGCFGLRYYTQVQPHEVAVGIPLERLAETVDNLEVFIEGDRERLKLLWSSSAGAGSGASQ